MTPLVSRVSPDPRRPGAVRVEVDGRPLVTVPASVVAELRVTPGTALEGETHDRLCQAADEEAAWNTALRALERRPFASRDLARRLVQKGHPPAAADAAIARGVRAGLLDDARFARGFVQTRFARGRGPGRLRRELTQLGVARDIVDRVLGEEVSPDDATEQAVALARRRAGQLGDLPRTALRRRVVAYLSRRGYSGTDIRHALEAAGI